MLKCVTENLTESFPLKLKRLANEEKTRPQSNS